MRKLGIALLCGMLAGCAGGAPEVSTEQTKGASKYKTLDWYKKPGALDIDDFNDIALVYSGNGYTGYKEQTGYSPTWLHVNAIDMVGGEQYTDNAIIGTSKDKKYIYNYDGKQITTTPFDNLYRDDILGLYGYNEDLTSSTVHFFDKDFGMHSQVVDGVGGDIGSRNAVYSGGKVYHDYDCVSSVDGFATDIPTIYPVKTTFTVEQEKAFSTGETSIADVHPDGYVILQKGADPIMIPDGMTPAYAPLVIKKDVWNAKDASYNTAFVNGCIKLLDDSNKVHLWRTSTQSYISGESFDDATFFEDGVIGVRKDGKWAFMDTHGHLITDYIFDKVSGVRKGRAYVSYHGKVGILKVRASKE